MPKYAVLGRSTNTSPWDLPVCFDWATDALRHFHNLLSSEEADLLICDLEAEEVLRMEDLQAQATKEQAPSQEGQS